MFPFVFFVGVCRNYRVLLAKMDSIGKPEREPTTKEFADDTEVLFPMEKLSLVSSQDQDEKSYSSRV